MSLLNFKCNAISPVPDVFAKLQLRGFVRGSGTGLSASKEFPGGSTARVKRQVIFAPPLGVGTTRGAHMRSRGCNWKKHELRNAKNTYFFRIYSGFMSDLFPFQARSRWSAENHCEKASETKSGFIPDLCRIYSPFRRFTGERRKKKGE